MSPLPVALLTALLASAAAPPASLEARQAALATLLHEHWESRLKDRPELASSYADPRYHDRLTDYSPEAVARRAEQSKRFLEQAEAIDAAGFTEPQALDLKLMVLQLADEVDEARVKLHEIPVTQLEGPHLDFGMLVALLPFADLQDFEDYLSRLKAFPVQLEQTAALMRLGIADGLVLPRYIVEKIAVQVEAMAKEPPDQCVFSQPIRKFPAGIGAADRKRLGDAIKASVKGGVLPAYGRFAVFLRKEYLPKGRLEPGLWAVPNGEAIYQNRIKHYTTLDLTAAQVHELGLKEVARLEAEMTAIAKAAGQKDLAGYRAALQKSPPKIAVDRAAVRKRFEQHLAAMQAKLPQLFGRLPRAAVDVRAVEPFRENDAAGAEYEEGTDDGARPGHVVVNLGQWLGLDALGLEATAYHEGVPGHHLQMSIAHEVPGLPPLRRHIDDGAFVEGWALYAEGLGKEVGFYKERESDFGRLDSALFRALRLVIDTGLHAKKWSRQQALDYLCAHASGSRHAFEVEIDRYVSWPGQALGYKLGQMKILQLREKAQKELMDRFDLRLFHDAVLEAGALPLDVLAARIDAWIAGRKAK